MPTHPRRVLSANDLSFCVLGRRNARGEEWTAAEISAPARQQKLQTLPGTDVPHRQLLRRWSALGRRFIEFQLVTVLGERGFRTPGPYFLRESVQVCFGDLGTSSILRGVGRVGGLSATNRRTMLLWHLSVLKFQAFGSCVLFYSLVRFISFFLYRVLFRCYTTIATLNRQDELYTRLNVISEPSKLSLRVKRKYNILLQISLYICVQPRSWVLKCYIHGKSQNVQTSDFFSLSLSLILINIYLQSRPWRCMFLLWVDVNVLDWTVAHITWCLCLWPKRW